MSTPWWAEAFGPEYLDVYPHRDLESARLEARFLLDHGLRGLVLDVCCGWGRHVLALGEQGLDVVGVDWSIDLLARAPNAAAAGTIPARLVRGDARALPFQDRTFDGAVSLFSSFGYFGEDGDRALLLGIARVLLPGGVAFLDLMNPAHVREHLVPETRTERDGAVLCERRSLAGPRVHKEIELRGRSGESRTWREDVRLYEPAELEARLEEAGFSSIARWGGFDGSKFVASSPRQLVRAERARR